MCFTLVVIFMGYERLLAELINMNVDMIMMRNFDRQPSFPRIFQSPFQLSVSKHFCQVDKSDG